MGVNIELLCLVCVYHTAKTPPCERGETVVDCHSTAGILSDASSDEDIETDTIPKVWGEILFNVMYKLRWEN